jgi:hypothetical protein
VNGAFKVLGIVEQNGGMRVLQRSGQHFFFFLFFLVMLVGLITFSFAQNVLTSFACSVVLARIPPFGGGV